MEEQRRGPGLDTAALTGPVDSAAAAEYGRRMLPQGTTRENPGTLRMAVMGAVVGLVVLETARRMGPLAMVVALGLIGLLVFAVLHQRRQNSPAHHYRLHLFAQANGWAYDPREAGAALPGMIFSHGTHRVVSRRVWTESPRFVECGNFRSETGARRHRTFHRWGYAAIRLQASAPHLVLDAAGTDGPLNRSLPVSMRGRPQLRLPRGHEDRFTLYGEADAERDAGLLLPREVLERLSREDFAADVEIVGEWAFLYTRREAVGLDPQMWSHLDEALTALLRAVETWERFRRGR